MAENLLHDLELDTLKQQQRGARVTEIVHSHVRQVGSFKKARKVAVEITRLDGAAKLVREYETALLPRLASLRRLGTGGLFDKYAQSFEAVWATSLPAYPADAALA